MISAQAPAPALRRIDAALDVVLDALMRVLAECYLRRLDPSTRAQALGALTRLFLALAGRPERDTALDQGGALANGQPMPSAETVAGWIRGWEVAGERLFAEPAVARGHDDGADARVFEPSEWPTCADCGARHPRGTAHRETAPVAEEPAVSDVAGEARS